MPRYLQKRRRLWYAVLEIPKSLRLTFGKPRFFQSLHTDSQSIAEQRVLHVVAEWKRQIEVLRSGKSTSDPLIALEQDRERLRREGYGDKEISDHHEDMAVEFQDDELYKSSLVLRGEMIRLDRHIDEYISSLDLEPKSIDMKRSDLKRFAKVFEYSEDVTKKTLINWVEDNLIAKQGLSPATCRRIISTCKGYWAYLERHKELNVPAPFSEVVPKTKKKKTKSDVKDKRKGFTVADYRKLKTAVPDSDPVLYDLITLGAYTGCRIEELCSLKLETVTDKSIEIEDAKTEAGWRTIPIHSDLRQLVARLRDTSTDEYLLSGLTFNKYGDRSNAIGKRFGRLKAKCGYGSDYVFHSFRKGVATQLETGRVPENITARLLGHDMKTMSYGLYSGGVSYEVLSEAIEHLSWK